MRHQWLSAELSDVHPSIGLDTCRSVGCTLCSVDTLNLCSQYLHVTQKESIDSGYGSRLHMASNFTHQACQEILPPIVFYLDCIAFLTSNWVCCILTMFQIETLRDENLHFVIAVKYTDDFQGVTGLYLSQWLLQQMSL